MKKKLFHRYEIGDATGWSFRAKIFISEDDRVLVVVKGLSNDEITITGDYQTALRKIGELIEVLAKTSEEIEAVRSYREDGWTSHPS